MPGIEVVGIVLGTIPLLISAIEHYPDGVSAVQRWRRFQREHKLLVRSLRREQMKMKNMCEELLRGLVPDSQIELMIEDPFGTQWRNDKINAKLKARLQDSLEVFQSTVTDIQTAVAELSRRLGITAQAQVKLFPWFWGTCFANSQLESRKQNHYLKKNFSGRCSQSVRTHIPVLSLPFVTVYPTSKCWRAKASVSSRTENKDCKCSS